MLIVAPSAVDPGAVLRARLTGFAGFLRANGFGVGGADSIRVLETSVQTGMLDQQILRWSLKALLCGRADEWRRFDALFDAYFLPPNKKVFVNSERVAPARADRPARWARVRDETAAAGATQSPATDDWAARGTGEPRGISGVHGLQQAESGRACARSRGADAPFCQTPEASAVAPRSALLITAAGSTCRARYGAAWLAAARRCGWHGGNAAACGRAWYCCWT